MAAVRTLFKSMPLTPAGLVLIRLSFCRFRLELFQRPAVLIQDPGGLQIVN